MLMLQESKTVHESISSEACDDALSGGGGS